VLNFGSDSDGFLKFWNSRGIFICLCLGCDGELVAIFLV